MRWVMPGVDVLGVSHAEGTAISAMTTGTSRDREDMSDDEQAECRDGSRTFRDDRDVHAGKAMPKCLPRPFLLSQTVVGKVTVSTRRPPMEETVSIGPSGASKELAFVVTVPTGSFTKVLPAQGTVRIGRSEECEIFIDDHAISRVHAVVHMDRIVGIEDRNGTVVLGSRVLPHERIPLPLGAVVEIGHAVLVLVRSQMEWKDTAPAMVVASDVMRRLYESLPAIAASPLCVLILGETGVGKDVLARSIHRQSTRAKGPFVAINCAALPESILESELFGHVRGAFTGAVQAKVGSSSRRTAGPSFSTRWASCHR
jgi:pSer/pThr/pTyr-binding forkhead associated (FHA) protein